MKVDQDTLERRLWAKMEKVKGDHEKGTRTDREMYVSLFHRTSIIQSRPSMESPILTRRRIDCFDGDD